MKPLESHTKEELIALIRRLLVRIEKLEAEVAKLRKNSSNSSKSPSSDIVKPPKPAKRKEKGKWRIGGQPGHRKHEREPFRPEDLDDTRQYTLDRCPDCGGRLRKSRRPDRVVQQVELIERPVEIVEHRSPARWCPSCRRHVHAPLPPAVANGGLIGPASPAGAAQADPAVDRVADTEYDADGRPRYGKTYNNNLATPFVTETIYDAHGRVERVIDPEGHYAAYDYAPNGRFHERATYDGVGLQSLVVQSYDGLDRPVLLKAEGPPDLLTNLEYDGLDRTVVTVDPNAVCRAVTYDLAGRPTSICEDRYGPLQRETCLTYNRLGRLVTRMAENRASDGTPLPPQVTTYRHDSLGRTTRVVYPDAPPADHDDPVACTDCVRLTYDYAGRPLQRQDQRNTTHFTFDARGQLHARTTGAARDTYHYDALGRIIRAARGTPTDEEAVASTRRSYTGLGDLGCEVQTIRKGTPRATDYDYDQAGNRTLLGYPDGEVLTYTPTALNQVDSILRAGSPLVQYGYLGRQLHTRTTTTDAPGGATTYRQT